MTRKARFTHELYDIDTFYFFRDLENLATGADGLTTLVVDAGTSVAVGDTTRGVAVITTGATDNNEAALRTTNELFLVAANRPLYGRVRLQYAEANTDDANVMVGFMSALAANSMVDDGAGPRTTGNYFLVEKRDGETTWRLSTRNGTGNTSTASTTTAGGSAFTTIEIEVEEFDSVNFYVVALVDGVVLKDSAGTKIRHTVAISGSTEMNFGVYAKAGGANSEVVSVDYLYAHQLR
jgi:hypothetical protein